MRNLHVTFELCLVSRFESAQHATLVSQSVESSDVCSKPAGDFDPEISSVLLNGIFRILRAAGIEIFLVEHIEDASRQVQVFSDSMSQKRDIENLIAA
jgi:hypothetical protein